MRPYDEMIPSEDEEDQKAALKRCSRLHGSRKTQCIHWFSILDKRKLCEKCRASSLRNSKTLKGKASNVLAQKKHRSDPKNKERRRKAYDTPEKNRIRYERKVATGTNVINSKKYRNSPKGKAAAQRADSQPSRKLQRSLYKMMNRNHVSPVSIPKLGSFTTSEDVRAHVESTFATWMNWSNQGPHKRGLAPKTLWQIGHRIPAMWYRHNDIDEVKKAWSRLNLFAQCAVENNHAKDRNILTQEQWLALKSIWPKQCASMSDEDSWEWARSDIDNFHRKIERNMKQL